MHFSPPSLASVGRQAAYVLVPRATSQHKGYFASVQSLPVEHNFIVSVALQEYLRSWAQVPVQLLDADWMPVLRQPGNVPLPMKTAVMQHSPVLPVQSLAAVQPSVSVGEQSVV